VIQALLVNEIGSQSQILDLGPSSVDRRRSVKQAFSLNAFGGMAVRFGAYTYQCLDALIVYVYI
jgi:hypothetical protein